MLLTVLLHACAGQPETNPRDAADANDTGRRVAAAGETERAVLGQLSTLRSGTPSRIRDAEVLAEAPYPSASGRTCRALRVTPVQTKHASQRLACSDGKAWFFVPDVFGSNAE